MNATVIGLTKEVNSMLKIALEDEKVFSGKNAGICYQKDGYFNTSVSDPVQAGKRFSRVAGINHHSISDHAKVEVLFENCSKMLAILLNSFQDYATSEKSGRYTLMTVNSEKETKLYDKWRFSDKSSVLSIYVDKLRGNKGCVNTKCKILGVCKEPCRLISTGDVFTCKI